MNAPTTTPRVSEAAWAGAHAGEDWALQELFQFLWPRAWRMAVSVTGQPEAAEDAVQDAFERCFSDLSRFPNVGALRVWLDRVVVSRAIDAVRREQRRPEKERAGQDRLGGYVHWLPEPADRDLLARCAALPDQMRAVVALHFWMDMRLAEIADCLDVPVGTVKSRLGRALEHLRAQIGANDD